MVLYMKNPFELLIRLMPQIDEVNLDTLECVVGDNGFKRGLGAILPAEETGLTMLE